MNKLNTSVPEVRKVAARRVASPVLDRSSDAALSLVMCQMLVGVYNRPPPGSGLLQRSKLIKKADKPRVTRGETLLLNKHEDFDFDTLCGDYMVGSLVRDQSQVTFQDGYLAKGHHLYTIYPQVEEVLIGKTTTEYMVYWMPQVGYCSKMVIMFHDMIRGLEYYHEGLDLMYQVWKLIQKSLQYGGTDNEETREGCALVKYYSDQYCKSRGIGCEEAEIPLSMALKQWLLYGVPISQHGSEGIVFSLVDGVVHVGYRCRYYKKYDLTDYDVEANGLDTLLKGTWDSFRFFVASFRARVTPDESSEFALPVEVKSWFVKQAVSYNLYWQDNCGSEIRPFASNNGFGTNSLYNILYLEHESTYVQYVKMDDSESGSTAPSSTPAEVKPAVVYDNPQDIKKSEYVVLRASYKPSMKFNGKKWYRQGCYLKCKLESMFCVVPSKSMTYRFWETTYDVVDIEKVDDIEVLTLVIHERSEVILSKAFGKTVSIDELVAPSQKHQDALDEWCHLEKKSAMVEEDFSLAYDKARSYISCLTKGEEVPKAWLENSLVLFAQKRREQQAKFKYLGSGSWLAAWYADLKAKAFVSTSDAIYAHLESWWKVDFFLLMCPVLFIAYILFSLLYYISFVFLIVFFPSWIAYLGSYTLWFSLYALFIQCSKSLYKFLSTVLSAGHLKVGRNVLDSTHLRQELSWDKCNDLRSVANWTTFSLSKMQCFWVGQKVSFQNLLSRLSSEKIAPFKYNAVSDIVDSENEKLMHKIAPASKIGSLWAFLVRASSPVAIPKIEHRNMMNGFSGTQDVIASIIKGIHNSKLYDFDTYLRQTLRRKRAAYKQGFDRFMEKPYIPSTMDIVVKPDEKQHHKGVFGDLFSSSYKPRNIFNPSQQVKGVGGWIMWNLMMIVKMCTIISGNFAAGKSPSQLEDLMTNAYHKMRDPVFISWDGMRHDSLQHAWALEDIDNEILRETIPHVCAKLGLNHSQTQAILENLTALTVKVRAMGKRKGLDSKHTMNMLFEATVFGTVFSGHPSRTTFGNTIRILMISMFACARAGIKWNEDLVHFQAGDDTAIVCERQHAQIFKESIHWVYEQYGLVMTDFHIGDTLEFLSRKGFYENGRVHLVRMADRVAQTGLYSVKVPGGAMPEFDKAICSQLAAWGSDVEGVKQVVQYRVNKLNSYNNNNSLKTNNKNKEAVHRALSEQWNILNPDDVQKEDLIQLDEGYKILAATGGDINAAIQRDC